MKQGEGRVAANGVTLRYRIDGPPSSPWLVLINGAFTNLEYWSPVMTRLASDFRVLRHDWRGTGQSSGGPRADYTFAQYAEDLRALMDVCEIERAVICGMAYGARIAARFALDHPSRVAVLALYDVSLDQPVDQSLQREGNVEAARLREAAGLPSVDVQRSWFAHADEKEARRSLTAHVGQPDPSDEMGGVRIPTLIACGRQDANLPEARRLAAILPDAEFHVMEMTGHGSVASRPDRVAELLRDFVGRRGAAAASRA
jgi:pimeloyl-ACP methyl ester carboxylesterase